MLRSVTSKYLNHESRDFFNTQFLSQIVSWSQQNKGFRFFFRIVEDLFVFGTRVYSSLQNWFPVTNLSAGRSTLICKRNLLLTNTPGSQECLVYSSREIATSDLRIPVYNHQGVIFWTTRGHFPRLKASHNRYRANLSKNGLWGTLAKYHTYF